jgi:hypothetical protein
MADLRDFGGFKGGENRGDPQMRTARENLIYAHLKYSMKAINRT